MPHRVRTIISYLEYGVLRQKKILPKQPLFTGIKRGGDFPNAAKKMGYAQFGMFLDHFIQKVLALRFGLEYEHTYTPAYDLYKRCVEQYFGGEVTVEKKTFHKEKDYYRDIAEFVSDNFIEVKSVELEPEWTFDDVSGHPDLVIDDTVYDIKTTGQFGAMRIMTIFQLLAYYCLAQLLGKNITHIGLVLPAQRTVLRADIHDWKWQPFWNELLACIQIKLKIKPSAEMSALFMITIEPFIGAHVEKQGTIATTLAKLPPDRPWQIFLGGRANANFKITDADIAKTAELTDLARPEGGYHFYVHSPYTLNLSKQYDDNWVAKMLGKHLTAGVAMGCRGVVVHCGVKAKGVEYQPAYDNMTNSIIQAAECASPTCPLLLETSAGETGELLPNPEEMVVFYQSLPEETQANVKICVDTCHVFAAGYIPEEYIHVLDEAKVPIGLFHFNDSKGDKGCCKDSHVEVGSGYVGLGNLINVGAYAIKNGIDMVFE